MQVQVDDGTERLVRAALEQTAPAVSREIERRIAAVLAEARSEWPVRTGASRDALVGGLRLPDSETLEGFVYDDVDYAYFIKGKRQGGKSTYVELVRKPMRAAAEGLVSDLGQVVVNAIERR
jgi:hypothetical protein